MEQQFSTGYWGLRKLKNFPTLRGYLPYFFFKPLFGDRRKFGKVPRLDDPCYIEWKNIYFSCYQSNKSRPEFHWVNNSGYENLKEIDLSGKKILEIGPGELFHTKYWKGKPLCFYAYDVDERLLEKSEMLLRENQIPFKKILGLADLSSFPLDFFDIIFSFFSLEHIYPLEPFLLMMKRILKAAGLFVGAIPAEGGLTWGFGRFLTSRRWLKSHSKINPDKIICWEHPNFADFILKKLERNFSIQKIEFWPFGVPLIDLNFTVRFVCRK